MNKKSVFSFIFIVMILASAPLFLLKERKIIHSKKSVRITLADQSFQDQLEQKEDVNFIVLMALSGEEETIERTLEAVSVQTYQPKRVVCLSKGGGDSALRAKNYIEEQGLGHRYEVVENPSFQSFVRAYDQVIQQAHEEDVVVHMRGCDFLAGDQVLETINYYYLHNDVWLTYGQKMSVAHYDQGGEVPYLKKKMRRKKIHQNHWVHAKFKTFLVKAYKNMRHECFDMEDFFLSIGSEEELLKPLAAYGCDHLRFIPDVLSVDGSKMEERVPASYTGIPRRHAHSSLSHRYTPLMSASRE